MTVHCYVHNEHSAPQLIYRGLYFGAPSGSKILRTGVHLHLGKVPADKGSVLAYAVNLEGSESCEARMNKVHVSKYG